MFGRRTSKSETETADEHVVKGNGKGRPTPKRSEAEAARKQRLKPTMDRRAAAKQQRERTRAERQKMREAMSGRGDERHLPPRDRGPVRRFARDFVDARRNVAEFLLPALLLILLLPIVGQFGIDAQMISAATGVLWLMTIVLTVLDIVLISFRMKKELAVRFPDSVTKGARLYAVMRSSQMRWLRLPKPRVKVGDSLDHEYR